MTHTYIEDIGKHVGGEVTLRGWVHNKRSSGKIQFLIVRDGTGYIQAVVVKNAVSPEIFAAADTLTHESSLAVTGKVRQDARAPSGYELDVTDLKVYQEISQAHLDGLKSLISAFKSLYDSMPAGQQKNADMVFEKYGPAKPASQG